MPFIWSREGFIWSCLSIIISRVAFIKVHVWFIVSRVGFIRLHVWYIVSRVGFIWYLGGIWHVRQQYGEWWDVSCEGWGGSPRTLPRHPPPLPPRLWRVLCRSARTYPPSSAGMFEYERLAQWLCPVPSRYLVKYKKSTQRPFASLASTRHSLKSTRASARVWRVHLPLVKVKLGMSHSLSAAAS